MQFDKACDMGRLDQSAEYERLLSVGRLSSAVRQVRRIKRSRKAKVALEIDSEQKRAENLVMKYMQRCLVAGNAELE